MHTLSILTAPKSCRAVLAAPSMATTLPLLGAVVSSSKALKAKGWKLESLGVAMKLLTVCASNVFKMVRELSDSRGSVLTSKVTYQEKQQQRAGEDKEDRTHLQQQGHPQQQQEHGQQQEQPEQQQQQELDRIAQLSLQAQLDGLAWVGWHCLYNVCCMMDSLANLLYRRMEEVQEGAMGGDRQGRGGAYSAGVGKERIAGGEVEGKEDCEERTATAAAEDVEVEGDVAEGEAVPPPAAAEVPAKPAAAEVEADVEAEEEAGVVAGSAAAGESSAAAAAAAAHVKAGAAADTSAAEVEAEAAGAVARSAAPPAQASAAGKEAPLHSNEYFQIGSSEIMERCVPLLENQLYVEGMAGLREAVFRTVAGRLNSTHLKCLLRVLQELSSCESAAGAGAAFKTALARSAEAVAAAIGVAVEAAAEGGPAAWAAAALQARVQAAAPTLAQALPLVLCPALPVVLGDILTAAALGMDTEVAASPEERWGDSSTSHCPETLGAQVAQARCGLVDFLEDAGRMAQSLVLTPGAVKDMADTLLAHVENLALSGLGRPVGFCCNNPTCRRLEGLGEVGLVRPGLKGAGVCGRCKAACYCCGVCQWFHGRNHFCKDFLKRQRGEDEKQQQGREQEEAQHFQRASSRV
jgi:hypothetical protein